MAYHPTQVGWGLTWEQWTLAGFGGGTPDRMQWSRQSAFWPTYDLDNAKWLRRDLTKQPRDPERRAKVRNVSKVFRLLQGPDLGAGK